MPPIIKGTKTGIRKNTRSLNAEVRTRFMGDALLLDKVAKASGKKWQSVRRWFVYNTEQLQRYDVVPVLLQETGLTYDEIFPPIENPKKA